MFEGIITLLGSITSVLGISKIYNGKMGSNIQKVGYGVMLFMLGSFATLWVNPLFPSWTIFSFFLSVGATIFLTGLVASTFLLTGKEKDVIVVEILGGDKKNRQEQGVETIDSTAEYEKPLLSEDKMPKNFMVRGALLLGKALVAAGKRK